MYECRNFFSTYNSSFGDISIPKSFGGLSSLKHCSISFAVMINSKQLTLSINYELACRKATIKHFLWKHENVYISENLFCETIWFVSQGSYN